MFKLLVLQLIALSIFNMRGLEQHLPTFFMAIPEFLSVIMLIAWIVHVSYTKRVFSSANSFFIILFLFHIVACVFANGFGFGIANAMRYHIKWISCFALASVISYDHSKVMFLFKFFTIVIFFQTGIALLQKFVFSHGITSGDVVRGTFESGSILSGLIIVYLTFIVTAIVFGAPNIRRLVFLSLVSFVPVTISETKGALVVFSFWFLFLIFYLGKLKMMTAKRMIKILVAMSLAVFLFITVYDVFWRPYGNDSLVSFFVSGDYLSSLKAEDLSYQEPKRIDYIFHAVSQVTQNMKSFLFGYGPGSATIGGINAASSLSEYTLSSARVLGINYLLIETGVVGTLLFLIFFGVPFMQKVKAKKDIFIKFCILNISVILIVYMFYKNIYISNVFSFVATLYGVCFSVYKKDILKFKWLSET